MSASYDCAIVTGASSGIGASLSLRLATDGVKVGLLARRVERLESLVDQIEKANGQALAIPCDVTDQDAVQAATDEVRTQFGPVDLMVANAGVGYPMQIDDQEIDRYKRMYEVNVFGAMHSILAVLPGMIERQRGHIVGISSIAAFRAYPHMLGYAGTKAALNHELEAVRNRTYRWNVDVTTICPGFIKTEMTEAADMPQPFRMDLEPAVELMYRAIRRRRVFYAFPMIPAWYHRLISILPPMLYDRLIRSPLTP